MIIGTISSKDNVRNKVKNSTSPEIEIAGIPTKKESLAAVFLSMPENKADVKVMPDLETPGNIAKDCDNPNRTTSFKLISLNVFFLSPYISESARNSAIRIDITAMKKKPLRFELE